jgi:polygalacturonase
MTELYMKKRALILLAILVQAGLWAGAQQEASSKPRLSILETGAVGDGKTLDTPTIQKAIDRVAAAGGGTVVIPEGRFLTGALFLKPGVNLHFDKNSFLQGSTNIEDYPARPTRIEGHTQVWLPALVNAEHCDGLQITGEGTLQGGGKPFWDAFTKRFKADKTTKNLDVPRPRNLYIKDSQNVLIQGISLRGSGFWNIHLYGCQQVTVEKVDIRTPPSAPSTDGIDVDSSQDVTIRGCYISVDDDDIALKGSKGPLAELDTTNRPVEHIRISDCTFGLGHAVLTLGSEACQVRDVVMENCRVEGWMEKNRTILLRLKLRQDTPQRYEDIHVRNVVFNAKGDLISIQPWNQYFDLKGQLPPNQVVENVTVSDVSGAANGFGRIAPPPKGSLHNIVLENIDLKLNNPLVTITNVDGLILKNVKFNGIVVNAETISKVKPDNANSADAQLSK